MKVIVFHSYKGGVGRTLALSNLGHALSRINKNVLILDWDFDAPGLAIKFDAEKRVGNGYVDYLSMINDIYGNDLELTDQDQQTAYLADCVIPVDSNEYLFLLPAGDRAKRNYWKKISSRGFQKFFDFSDAKNYNKRLMFFQKDRELLKSCLGSKGEVDYLLIDSKTGNEKAIIPIMIFADHVVELFNCNNEGVFGELHIRSAIHNLREKDPGNNVVLTSTMTRVPANFTEKQALEQYKSIARHMLNRINLKENKLAKRLLLVHELRQLEIYEKLLLSNLESPENLLLTHDYVELFDHIFQDDIDIKKGIDSLGHPDWKTAMGLAAEYEYIDYYFLLHWRQGELINEDNERNVAINSKTLKTWIDSLTIDQKKFMTNEGYDDKTIKEKLKESFHQAGCRAGGGFGIEAITPGKIWEQKVAEDFDERLQKWLDFDRTAGFGHWELNHNGGERKITILLHDHFLKKTEYGYHFIAGYIKGVVSSLIPSEYSCVEIESSDNSYVCLTYG